MGVVYGNLVNVSVLPTEAAGLYLPCQDEDDKQKAECGNV